MNEELKSRLRTLAWSAGMMSLVAVLDYIAQGDFPLGGREILIVVAGLIAAQISKAIKNAISE